MYSEFMKDMPIIIDNNSNEDYIDDFIREDSIETEISFEDKYINKLKEIYENYKDDNEALHIFSDDCLLDFLEESGYENIAKFYKRNKESFWYS